jgi:hypothetical protein
MSDRETRPDKTATSSPAQPRGDDRSAPEPPDVAEPLDPDSEQSTASRPRGHTEEPDRTL